MPAPSSSVFSSLIATRLDGPGLGEGQQLQGGQLWGRPIGILDAVLVGRTSKKAGVRGKHPEAGWEQVLGGKRIFYGSCQPAPSLPLSTPLLISVAFF